MQWQLHIQKPGTQFDLLSYYKVNTYFAIQQIDVFLNSSIGQNQQ